MVSFSCEVCGDVLNKKKLDPHRSRCRGATFTCLDCMVHFPGLEYRSHTTCISEDQKYQGALYKNKKPRITAPSTTSLASLAPPPVEPPKPVAMPQRAYVEDLPEEEYRGFADYEDHSDDEKSPAEPPPEAPTPPPAHEASVNVFDFLVASSTPNQSVLDLTRPDPRDGESTQLVRYDYEANAYLDHNGFLVDEEALVQYGTGPIPSAAFKTPAHKADRKRTEVKDKKRKRLHVDVPGDQVMTDAPPVLHSGLTGGLTRLMRPIFPPSPDYSGGDAAETPASPLKKTKHSRHHTKSGREGIGNNLLAMVASTKAKPKKRKVGTKKHSSHHHRSDSEKTPKLIEYRPQSREEKGTPAPSNQMVVFKPRANLFLGFINKGPESERGCSVNKALKRFHRERVATGGSLGKHMEEKELWRSLRMRRNERGEIVLFCLED